MDRNSWTEYTDADGNEDFVSYDGTASVKTETDKALLVRFEEDPREEVWIPKSQISEESEVYEKGTSGKLVIKKWFAKEKGWL